LSANPVTFSESLSVDEIKEILSIAVFGLLQEGYKDSTALAGNCVPVNMLINHALQSLKGINSYITIGDRYWSENDIYCEMSYTSIVEELKHPNITKPIKAHTWITLTDGTIIDFTSEAHLDVLHDRGVFPVEKCYQVIRPDSDITSGFHRPFLIGTDFLFKTGLVQYSVS